MTGRTARPPRALADLLRPCPFCGGGATLEHDPWLDESVRIACGNASCRVSPKTEYLLAGFADELCAAWNGRAGGCPDQTAETSAQETDS